MYLSYVKKVRQLKNVKKSLEGNSHSARGRHGTILSFLVLTFLGKIETLQNKIVNFICFTAHSEEVQTKS